MSESPEYILDRVFDAPRELVWRAWTDPELLYHWPWERDKPLTTQSPLAAESIPPTINGSNLDLPCIAC